MAAPVRKVAPNGFFNAAISNLTTSLEQDLAAAQTEPLQAALSALGAIVSSTCPGTLHRATRARAQIRRASGLK